MDNLSLQDLMEMYSAEHKAALINDGVLVGFTEEGNEGDDC